MVGITRSCGETKTSTCGVADLACNLEEGHDPAFHGISLHRGMPTYIRWGPSICWTAEDQARVDERHATWHKGHVRRNYETLAMWKAAR